MRFSQHFGINADQSELDFVDVFLDRDIELFIDPYAIATRNDAWSAECAASVNSFFQQVIDAIRRGNEAQAILLLNQLHEPNETRLGLSSGKPSGRGIGGRQANQLFTALSQSAAVRTGFVEDLADCELVIEGIGPDKLSDITTNLIRGHLIQYTQVQCANYGLQLVGHVASGPVWNAAAGEWRQSLVQVPHADGEKILLVPKFSVRWNVLLQHGEYYRHFVLNYIRENPQEFGGLAHLAKNKQGRIFKGAIEEEFPLTKEFLLQFSQNHPEIFEEYKATKAAAKPISDEELINGFDRHAMVAQLGNSLTHIPAGHVGESRYHRLIAGILSFLFYPNLISPRIEEQVNEGRKRIDITYVNGVRSGLFARFAQATNRPAPKIVVECKNYSSDIGNPEVDQVLGRFADHRGWLGFLLCRSILDRENLERRCRDVARDFGGYIIALDDEDVLRLLENSSRRGEAGVNEYISQKFGRLTL